MEMEKDLSLLSKDPLAGFAGPEPWRWGWAALGGEGTGWEKGEICRCTHSSRRWESPSACAASSLSATSASILKSASKLTEDKEEPEAVGSASEAVSGKKRKAPITLSLKRVCKVCKGKGHEAGFRGATYIDCPRKPCFLCKMPGHTTISCPHRVAMEHGTFPARCREGTQTHLDYVFKRQLRGKLPVEHYS